MENKKRKSITDGISMERWNRVSDKVKIIDEEKIRFTKNHD